MKRTPPEKGFLRIEAGTEVDDVEEIVVVGVADASKVGAQEIVRDEPKSPRGGAADEEEGPSLKMLELEVPPPPPGAFAPLCQSSKTRVARNWHISGG